ncbi:MAG: hypothetical protein H7Y13_03460 [Sphingobacteriaceae bacterium]|nr:hypothetical protein [Sphingobacteriaceae bacterium]
MKSIYCMLILSVFALACSNEREVKTDAADTLEIKNSSQITTSPYSVEYDENTQNLSLIKSRENAMDASVADIIRVLNQKYEGIKLDLVNEGTDTVEVKIDDASKLNQQMGTAGAEAYLAELTFSFTELKGVKAVKIDFEEGDHAMPGVYSRDDFNNLTVNK